MIQEVDWKFSTSRSGRTTRFSQAGTACSEGLLRERVEPIQSFAPVRAGHLRGSQPQPSGVTNLRWLYGLDAVGSAEGPTWTRSPLS